MAKFQRYLFDVSVLRVCVGDHSQLLPQQRLAQETVWPVAMFVFLNSVGCGGHLESYWSQNFINF